MSNSIARNWIDGGWVTSDRVSSSMNPSDGEILGRFADGGAKEASAAISAARRAFDTGTWSSDRSARAAALVELAHRLEERVDRLATSEAREMGKVITQTRWEAAASPPTIPYNAPPPPSPTRLTPQQTP